MEADFKSGKELLELCQTQYQPISEIMKLRECQLEHKNPDEITEKMKHALEIMKESSIIPVKNPKKSIGGLIGGEAQLLDKHRAKGKNICGNVLSRAMTYAVAMLEVNASMGLIVAAPTAGSSGIVPGLMLALKDEYHISDDRVINVMFNAGAIG